MTEDVRNLIAEAVAAERAKFEALALEAAEQLAGYARKLADAWWGPVAEGLWAEEEGLINRLRAVGGLPAIRLDEWGEIVTSE